MQAFEEQGCRIPHIVISEIVGLSGASLQFEQPYHLTQLDSESAQKSYLEARSEILVDATFAVLGDNVRRFRSQFLKSGLTCSLSCLANNALGGG